ncbi:MAG: hypothetical protein KKA19_09230 [Candidatus Margulisbacteria bacterium]|nr:hypothetical protein [Candidatus Margulisiibacteriota bacterium]
MHAKIISISLFKKAKNLVLRPLIKKREKKDLLDRIYSPHYLPSYREIINKLSEETRELSDFCRSHSVHEVFTIEYIDQLSDYLINRSIELRSLWNIKGRPIRILEVGASNGKLANFLGKALNKKAPDIFQYFAVDLYANKYNKNSMVETMDHKEGLEKHDPDIALFSWLPEDTCTKDFRAWPNLKEYILIGESDGGCCGNPETWEDTALTEAEYKAHLKGNLNPHVENGFIRVDREDFDQINRMDWPSKENFWSTSKTVSFRRDIRAQ